MRRSLTLRSSPRTLASIKAAPTPEALVPKEMDDILERRKLMFQADRAYSKLIADSQQVFIAMQDEYTQLLQRCN